MKNLRFTRALVLLALATVSLAAVQDGTVIKRALTAKDKQSYKLVSDTRINADTPAGPQEGGMKSSGKIETSVGTVKGDGSSAEYTMVTTVDDLKADGMLAAMGPAQGKVPPMTYKGTIDAQNKLSQPKVADTVNPMSIFGGSDAAQIGLFVTFPATPVKEGDTWPVAVPPSVMNKEAQSLTAKLLGTRDLNGVKVLVISLSGHLLVEPDQEAMKKAAAGQANGMEMTIKVKGTSDIDSEILIDPATGNTVQASSKIKGKFDLDIVEMSLTIHATSDTTVKMTKAQ